ncbi:AraC family transcriptional regulator [Gracilibacillus alcaliphilus]|uniref:AraC family transcriptional regulator n=1 Tax=Gracilibacillus alcaliphilus TaxID=1401441 RepID=UPI00195695A0|nr:helix-turn-helix domain-containing protein [Gracilibacillus alcaliphilus]MBM7679179.1 YesN/AraC family two-component response regulator [Gracilibacillus alcaliphilus]
MKKISSQHYFKLIAFLVILSTVPVIITGGLSYWQSSKAIVDYSNDEKRQNIYQIQTNVEQVLRYIDLSTTYFVRSAQTQAYLREDMHANAFSDFHKLRKDLNHLQTIETGIEDIVLVNLEKHWLVNNDGLVRLDNQTYQQINQNYLQLPGKSMWITEEADQLGIPNATKKSCSQYINLVKKLPVLSTNYTGLISVIIPTCELSEIMLKSNDSESFLILDKENHTIAQSNTEYTSEVNQIPNELFDQIDWDASEGEFEYRLNNTDYKISYQTSDYNNWTYLSLVKLSDLHKRSSSIGWLTLSIVIILLVISLYFAFIGSKVLYKPVKKLQQIIDSSGQGKSTANRSINEFDMIESHIERLLNQNHLLEQRVQNQVSQLKQLFMIRLLQGKVSQNEIPLKCKSFNYSQDWNLFSVFSLKIDEIDQQKFSQNDQDLILFAINNLMEDLLSEKECLTPVVINDTQATIILTNSNNEAEYTRLVNQKVELIQSKVQELLHLSVSIGISKRYQHLDQAHLAFKESKEALKYRLKMGEASIIFYENLNRRYSNVAPYPTAIKDKIFDAIKLSDQEVALKELAKFFEYVDRHDIHHQQLEIILSRFLYELYELKESLGAAVEQFQSTDMITHYQNLRSIEAIHDWVSNQIILPLIHSIDEKDDSKNRKISDKIIQIIHENYDKDLSLDIVAAELHYNPNYLSSIFQKETGYPFSEYLLRYRLNKAKEWLVTTDLSVKEIAERLQYNNSQNFIRSFRKMEETTPGKYRTQYKNKEA